MITKTEFDDIEDIKKEIEYRSIINNSFLITGGTGSLARYIIHVIMKILLESNCSKGHVYVLCRNVEMARKIFDDYKGSSKFDIIEGKVESFEYSFDKIDYIFHAASISNSAYFRTNPVETLTANIIGTYRILELARIYSVKSVLFFSSGAVYGHYNKKQNKGIYNGISPLEIENSYAIGKLAGENLCISYNKEYGVPSKIVRIGYTYGPHMNINDGHLYSDFVKSIMNNDDLVIKGDGEKNIGLCYISDAVRAFFKIIFNGEVGKPYVMRNWNTMMPIKNIAKIIVDECFPEKKLKYICLKKGEPEKNVVNLIPEELININWTPKIGIREGFRRTIKIIEEHKINEQ